VRTKAGFAPPAFPLALQVHKPRDNHPHAGHQNHGSHNRLPQIQLPFFESFLFQLLLCVMTMRVTDQACARHPQAGVRGDSILPYAVLLRSATELSWGMKMGAQRNKRRVKYNARRPLQSYGGWEQLDTCFLRRQQPKIILKGSTLITPAKQAPCAYLPLTS
jgi:hypothetical protein